MLCRKMQFHRFMTLLVLVSLCGCAAEDAGTSSGSTKTFGSTTIDAYSSSLAVYWKFEETSGTQWADSVSGVNLTSAAGVSTANLNSTTGIRGSAASLTRSSLQYGGNAAATSVAPSTALVVSAWVNSTGASSLSASDMYIVVKGETSGGTQVFDLYLQSSGAKFQLAATGSSAVATLPSDGSWHHLVGIASGSTVEVYVDGVKGSTTVSGAVSFGALGGFKVGGKQTGTYNFDGKIDEVAIWKDISLADSTARQALVTALYASGSGKFLQ